MLILLMLLSACASVLKQPEPPRVSVVGLEIVEVGLFEQRYVLKLRLQNTNDSDLKITGLDYELHINDHPFAHGVNRNKVVVPAFGEDIIELEVVSNLTKLFEQIRALEKRSFASIQYRISGSVKLGNWPTKIPFDYTGEFIPLKPQQAI